MEKEVFINFLNDTIKQLIELAEQAKTDSDDEFTTGIVHGYYGAILRVLNQVEVFEITNKLDVEIQSYIPENLLIKGGGKLQ